MKLSMHTLKKSEGTKKTKKRLGRGYGSGKGGHTVGRGMKGQKSRAGSSGHKRRGMRRLLLSTPKLRGFKSPNDKPQTVGLSEIDGKYIAKEVVTPKTLASKGLVRYPNKAVKILANGEITKAVIVKSCSVSKTAAEKIIATGGKIEA